MQGPIPENIVTLDVDVPIWERFFTIAPLVLIGTKENSGRFDLAPKHMVSAMGWGNYFGFVCTPRHGTYGNVARERVFTVSYPRPSQILLASLAAAPRCGEQDKPSLQALPTFPASKVDGVLLKDGYLFFECELDRIIDGFDDNSLITGCIVATHVDENALRSSELDDQDLINSVPLLAYLHPGRFATIDQSQSFPFPAGLKK